MAEEGSETPLLGVGGVVVMAKAWVAGSYASGTGPSSDGSGYYFDGVQMISANGKQINAPVNSQTSSGAITDANGNVINNNGDGTFTDTLGKTALTISGSGTASSPRLFTDSTPTGTVSVTVSYKTYTVQTVFGCTAGDYDLSQDLVDKISLADGSVYQFSYETTPGHSPNVTGRLAQLTLPQGGTIQYTYTGANNGIICADGTPAGLTRTGGVNRTYVRSSVTATTSHTDVTDGLSNLSNYDFVMAGSPEAFTKPIEQSVRGRPQHSSRGRLATTTPPMVPEPRSTAPR